MELTYVGPDPNAAVGALPLPEGWPAFDHAEADKAVAAAKVESGLYKRAKGQAIVDDAAELDEDPVTGRKRRG